MQAERWLVGYRHGAISIYEPEIVKHPILNPAEDHNRVETLRLRFHDLDEPREGFTLMTEDQANKILGFVERLTIQGQVEGFMIHCYAGVSRSRGVAVALSKIYGLDDTDHWQKGHPNAHVIATMMRAWAKRQALGAMYRSGAPKVKSLVEHGF